MNDLVENLSLDKLGAIGIFAILFSAVILYFSLKVIKMILTKCCNND